MKKHYVNTKYLLYQGEECVALEIDLSKRKLERIIAFISITCESIDYRFKLSSTTFLVVLYKFYGALIPDDIDFWVGQYDLLELNIEYCYKKHCRYEKRQKLMMNRSLFREGLHEFCQSLIENNKQKYGLLPLEEQKKVSSFTIVPNKNKLDIYYSITPLGDEELCLTSAMSEEEAHSIMRERFGLQRKYIL